ncbi:RhoGAP-domain-containing protein [Dendrothele bispora CBS 962.96]|uniref:RhoGAP-domain-containing protein n=1 Tax=Dendrothele bispora (strain CBS 962.96) TaxID=1314807 RepID=A0A4S8LTU1_DENBC|nr:RhoGAP-domain-containing protein [Dendrothele bispora CBS 962.96]
MPEDAYPQGAWDSTDLSDSQGTGASSGHGRPPIHPQQSSSESSGTASHYQRSGSPQPRLSSDSGGVSSTSKWRDTTTLISESHESASGNAEPSNLVETTFDENVLRALCDMDCGVPLLLDRIKQSMVSCREASVFLKKRAVIEEEYGKSLQKLARTTSEVYSMNDGKAGTFVNAWQSTMRIHEIMGENRARFAQRLNEMSEELATIAKEVDKTRKSTKELATRYERALQEAEGLTEKSKNRLDISSEELERLLLQKEGEASKDNYVQAKPVGGKRAIGKAVAKGGLLLKGKNPGNIQRQEDEIRARVSAASDTFRKAVIDAQTMRQEYFNFQLPRILRALKECSDEIDLGTQYHLTRYAFLFESIVLSDGSTLVPSKDESSTAIGLKTAIEMIDNRGDFKTYMQNYAFAHGSSSRGPRREGPSDEGFLPPLVNHQNNPSLPSNNSNNSNNSNGIHVPDKGRPTFGVDLGEQMIRDDVDVPPIMRKCCEAIEKYGLDVQGIYRLSGTTSKVQKLKQLLDKDLDSVDLDSPEWSSDINNVTGVLKMWLRELPEPLMTFSLQQSFIEAAKIENDRLRHIRLHERVNDLPDPNYATLKYLLGHLHEVYQHSSVNSMTVQNLAIVFGPTLFGSPVPNAQGPAANGVADAPYQNMGIETILKHYNDIFVEETA